MPTTLTRVLTYGFGLAAVIMLAGCGGGGTSATSTQPPAGTLDTAFGNEGAVITPISDNAYAQAVAIQPDGRIVVGGYSIAGGGIGNWSVALTRYTTTGTLDSTFGDRGLVEMTVPVGAINQDTLHGIAVQPDGKIVTAVSAVGFAADYSYELYCALIRYQPDGRLDPTFGVGGVALNDLWYVRSGCYAVALQPDGKVVAVGGAGPGISIIRLNSDGGRDSSFGINGVVVVSIEGSSAPIAVAIQPDGMIVVAGRWSTGGHGSAVGHFAVLRVDTVGNLDLGFGNGGVLMGTLPECCVDSGTVLLQQDGKIVIVVSGVVLRLLPSGTLDARFGVGGIATVTSSDPHAHVGYVAGALQENGKILIAGGGTFGFSVARLTAAGFLDLTFGDDGRVDTKVGELGGASAIALQPDGRIVAAGSAYSPRVPPNPDFSSGQYQFGLVRYFGD